MKGWRESASLIIAVRHAQKCMRSSLTNFQYNYNLLCMKRQQNANVQPNTYVFPGGAIDPSDADLKWHDLFSAFGIDANSFTSLKPNVLVRPPIFKFKANELPREISLRISAIRETFEESGILICRQPQQETNNFGWADYVKISENEIRDWQTRVHNDAKEFYTLCESFNCYPDLWSLHEWSNWLTPTYFVGKRFDTAFYLACISSTPRTVYDVTEMQALRWDTPGNLLVSPDVTLPPPQQYEIARLAKFESIDNLLDFAVERSKMGVLLNLPIKIELQDGNVYVLPGDSMYPKQVNLLEKQVINRKDVTIHQFREMSSAKNRVEFPNLQVREIYVQNLDSADGHLAPLQMKNISGASISKKPKL